MTEKYNVKPEQARALEDLEKILWKTIPQLEDYKPLNFGVKIEGDNIVGLGLFNQGLATLPESIGNLKSLQKLDLSGNELTTVPESIGNLKSLQTLNLSGSNSLKKLTTLPESIGKLSSLKGLMLRENKLTTLPESIGNLSSLKGLGLGENKLMTLPKSIGNLKSLQKLNLYSNELTTLPESIGNLSSLIELNLENNQLSTLPESFSQLKGLKKINLKTNDWKGEWQEMATNDIPTILNLCRKLYGIDIFISHAVKDQADYPIIELKKYLEKGDSIHNVLICEEDLRDSIQAFMNDNVPRSQLLLFIATENSLPSKDCLYELSLARKYGVKILPLKGIDITWDALSQIDLSKHDQEELNLSNPKERFEFVGRNFDEICKKLSECINKLKPELKPLKKEQEKLDNGLSNISKNVNDFINSSEFKAHLEERFEEFKKIFQEASNDQITSSEYYWKLGQILDKKTEN